MYSPFFTYLHLAYRSACMRFPLDTPVELELEFAIFSCKISTPFNDKSHDPGLQSDRRKSVSSRKFKCQTRTFSDFYGYLCRYEISLSLERIYTGCLGLHLKQFSFVLRLTHDASIQVARNKICTCACHGLEFCFGNQNGFHFSTSLVFFSILKPSSFVLCQNNDWKQFSVTAYSQGHRAPLVKCMYTHNSRL